jgi:chromosome condensin MukBEF complex kleisin-like MukF subunit
MRQEAITLDEGDVVISFPENLSAQSFGDLKDHLALFIKKMQRRAYIRQERWDGR